ncbi:MAG TPA: potassium transporter TrkG [Fontimonas sp.]
MSAVAAQRPSAPLRRFAAVQRVTGILLMMFSITMLPPLLISLHRQEGLALAFAQAMGLTLGSGAAVFLPVRRATAELKIRDGFLVVVLFWVVLSAFGAVPFFILPIDWLNFTDAVFESTSGLTTTGATAIAGGLDAMPWSILYYRTQLHWLGGMGVIVLAVALLPMLGIGGMQLFRAETPGPMKNNKLTPRIASTARALWLIYLAITAACILTYWALGMSFFDALCHGMSTVATGGFANHDASIGYFESLAIEIACMVFMLVGATNFTLHFLAWRRKSVLSYLRDAEFRAFVFTVLALSILVCVPLWLFGTYETLGAAIRYGLFQLIAFGSNAGFATADPTHWPAYVPLLIVLSGFMVGCAGSTSAGIKVARLVLIFKQLLRELQRLLHPNATILVKFGRRTVPDEILYAVSSFFFVYVVLTVALTFAMVLLGEEPVVAFSTVAAAINNEGPGLGHANATMAGVSDAGKWLLIVTMIMGRLEIFTFLIIFTPGFWRR